jgi:hypothetical protein
MLLGVLFGMAFTSPMKLGKSALDKNFVVAIIQPLLIIRTTQPYQIPASVPVI